MLTEELKDKISFVNNLSIAITSSLSWITKISYEVFENTKYDYIQEYLKVEYKGGAYAIRNCNGNSRTAIFEEVAKLLNGGYYDEVSNYVHLLADNNFKKLN